MISNLLATGVILAKGVAGNYPGHMAANAQAPCQRCFQSTQGLGTLLLSQLCGGESHQRAPLAGNQISPLVLCLVFCQGARNISRALYLVKMASHCDTPLIYNVFSLISPPFSSSTGH